YYCTKQDLKTLGANPKVGLNFDAIPVLKYFFDSALFIQQLEYGRTDIRVYTLQKYLMKFGYMDKKTGYFGPETKRALCNYQLRRGITSRKYCGVFGPRTRYYMKLEAKARGFLPDFGEITNFEDLVSYAANYNGNRQNLEIINSSLSTTNYFNIAYKKGTTDSKISDLQDMLRHYGFYQGELNSTYDGSTINSVHNFQVAAGILRADDYSNPANGWMGPSTRKALNEKRIEFQEWKNSPPYEGG
ncbi:MAG TPA: peptidoglycan-binding domain-containing protein, partial [Candidatus Absconditabacterales bacterium]|nr:peptidoglycan-binding domain-containing protein [Candidatus Absconditabacterales bacterium]